MMIQIGEDEKQLLKNALSTVRLMKLARINGYNIDYKFSYKLDEDYLFDEVYEANDRISDFIFKDVADYREVTNKDYPCELSFLEGTSEEVASMIEGTITHKYIMRYLEYIKTLKVKTTIDGLMKELNNIMQYAFDIDMNNCGEYAYYDAFINDKGLIILFSDSYYFNDYFFNCYFKLLNFCKKRLDELCISV